MKKIVSTRFRIRKRILEKMDKLTLKEWLILDIISLIIALGIVIFVGYLTQ